MKFKKLIKITIPALVFCVFFSVSAFASDSISFPIYPITYSYSPILVGSYTLVYKSSGEFNGQTQPFSDFLFNYNGNIGAMASPTSLSIWSNNLGGDLDGYFGIDTFDINAPSSAPVQNMYYYGIDVLTYNPVPNYGSAGTGPGPGGADYWQFNFSVALALSAGYPNLSLYQYYAIPIIALYTPNQDVLSPPSLYFCYGSGACLGDNGSMVFDSDANSFYSINFSCPLSDTDIMSDLSSVVNINNYDTYFAGFRFIIVSPYDGDYGMTWNETPVFAVPRTVHGYTLNADEYANELAKQHQQETLDAISGIEDTINSPIDNTPINDFESIEGSSGDDAEGVVDDVWDYFDTNGNILADNSPLKNAFLLVGNQFTFIFGANSYTIWLFMFVIVIILIGVVVRRGIFSSGTSAVNRFRNRRNRKE